MRCTGAAATRRAPVTLMTSDLARRVEPRRLYQQTADQIRALIRSGAFPADSRLPSERDLAQHLGVSRPSLREALVALDIDGSVEIRMGSGVYVRGPIEQLSNSTGSMGDSPSEIMQARVTIEGSVVMQACVRMTERCLDALDGAIIAMRSAIVEGRDPLAADRLFHETIAGQTGNAVLMRIVGELFDERRSLISSRISKRFEGGTTWAAAIAEHEDIHAALIAADPLRAECAMRTHLYRSAERWLDGS